MQIYEKKLIFASAGSNNKRSIYLRSALIINFFLLHPPRSQLNFEFRGDQIGFCGVARRRSDYLIAVVA